ncbi:MAG: hypothetical protein AAGD35_11955 [Actinomycetota bacterium]
MATAIAAHLRDGAAPRAVVDGVDRPRRIRELPSPSTVTHAVVDLSYGRYDLDGPSLRPELETGTDAIELLHRHCPGCEVVVATRNDTEMLTEMVVAIRQTWPDVAFFHKADDQLPDRVAAFVTGHHYQDNAEIALDLIGVERVTDERLRCVADATGRARPTARLVRALADCTEVPTREQMASILDVGGLYVRSLAHDLTSELRERGLLRGQGGLHPLWRWSRARRAVVRRAFADLLAG